MWLRLIIILLIPVANVFWYPLSSTSLFGVAKGLNLTPTDVLLLLSWTICLLSLISRRNNISNVEKAAWYLVALVNVPLLLSPIASIVASNSDNLVWGMLVHLKRIGLPCVLVVLSVQCSATRYRKYILGSIIISILVLLYGSPGDIGLDTSYIEEFTLTTGRSVSMMYNPNTLGTVTGLYILIFLGSYGLSKRRWPNPLLLVGLVLSMAVFLSAASRAATAALIPAMMYLTYRYWSKRSVVFWLIVLLFLSSTLLMIPRLWQEIVLLRRLSGTEVVDQNFSARVHVQSRALYQAAEWPLGTGIENIGNAVVGKGYLMSTTDSLYIDYLVSLGVAGLVLLIFVFRQAWKLVTNFSIDPCTGQALILFSVIVSFATLGIAVNFVSSIFFLSLGMGLTAETRR
jgi:hypothetical protein